MLAESIKQNLGTLGAWGHASAFPDERARALEQLGYTAIWLGGSPGGELDEAHRVLAATDHVVVATGIVNIWSSDSPPARIAAAHRRLQAEFPGRFLLGVGAGHPEADSDYRKPYGALVEYLDGLDAGGVPADERVLAALGPKVLQLAAERTAGAHPYLVTPEHTRSARELLGPDVLIAPEHKAVVNTDPVAARALGRPRVANPYLHLSNYLANLRRLGFTDADLAGTGSDELIDALVAHGDGAAVAARLRAHLDAGADHVSVQLITAPDADPLVGYSQIAQALLG